MAFDCGLGLVESYVAGHIEHLDQGVESEEIVVFFPMR
jgi:hypothetical protein